MNILEIRDVTIRYPTQKVPTLKEWVIRSLTSRAPEPHFDALRDITLELAQGESLGIIGPNGAGKSTLLRVAAGVITPSTGYAVTRGSVAPLIELGTGFDPELTGLENIYFNGALLGRPRKSIDAACDGIVDFAGLGEFIHAPLRTYSTGMVARLAFSVATAVQADIILLDEILSVGDATFRKRCEDRIRRFYSSGSTVLLVSHELDEILELCQSAIWIQDGEIHARGATADVVARYRDWADPTWREREAAREAEEFRGVHARP